MSSDALTSFLIVLESLKELAVESMDKDNIKFSIENGSAKAVIANSQNPKGVSDLYEKIDTAIKGKCDDSQITSPLRRIQEELKDQNFFYFTYNNGKQKIAIDERLRRANRIQKRRVESEVSLQLKVLSGTLNQIGGNEPNYHIDYGGGVKKTIEFDKNQTKDIIQHLYRKTTVLTVCKNKKSSDGVDKTYSHKLILEDNQVQMFKSFLRKYNSKQLDLVDRLSFMYEYFDGLYKGSNKAALDFLGAQLVAFNDKRLHLSELKTLLVIS